MADWTLIRESSQFALGGAAAFVAVGGFARQWLKERPRLSGSAVRALVLSEDLQTAHFVVVKASVTNGSASPNSLKAYRLSSGEYDAGPAIYGTTADGKRWFLRSPDEQVTAYFPTLSPADIPLKALNLPPGHTVEFEMPFALPGMAVKAAMAADMKMMVEAGMGRAVSIDVAPIEELHLVRARQDGTHQIELYGPDGSRISFQEALKWERFEVEPRS